MALTIHGYRTSFGTPKPIYDHTELLNAVRLRGCVRIGGQDIYPYKLEREDGSGRNWNVYGHDRTGKSVTLFVYALRTA